MVAAGLTAWTLVLVAPTAPPRSGPNCTSLDGSCISYPYTAAADYVPQDFVWMVPAFFMGPLAVLLVATLEPWMPRARRAFRSAALAFAAVAAGVLCLDYYVQFTTVQTSLIEGELGGGLSILSQYNPHGVFVALEDVGYFMMSLTFLFAGLALHATGRPTRLLRRVLLVAGTLGGVGLPVFVAAFGRRLEYFYEIYALSLTWLAFLVVGSSAAVVFARAAGRSSSTVSSPTPADLRH